MIHRSLDFGTDTWVNYHFGLSAKWTWLLPNADKPQNDERGKFYIAHYIL